MFLSKEEFSEVIKNTPLVSIDLIIYDTNDEVLVGKRLNRPAQNYWFVPGGRIQKNESLKDAFARLTKDELGTELSISDSKCIGAYDHFYDDNVFGTDFSTHYVAIGYVIKLKAQLPSLPFDDQHDAYQWMSVEKLLSSDEVHVHSKQYFY